MPIQEAQSNGRPGYRYGSSGKVYTYTPGDDAAKLRAKKKAIRQGVAIGYRTGEAVKVLKNYSGQGVMIAMPIPVEVASALGSRGVPPEDMHCTLAYLGKVQDLNADVVKRAVDTLKDVALCFRPMRATLGGYGVFKASESSDGKDVMYASYDCPMLPELRQTLVDELRAAGVALKGMAHGFTPHVTTDYLERGKIIDPPSIPDTTWDATTVCIWIGDVRIDVPLGAANAFREQEEIPDASSEAAMTDGDAAALDMMGLSVVEKEDRRPGPEIKVQIVGKELEMDQLVYGVVLEPNSVDGDDQVMTAADIEWTAHHFMAVQGIAGYRHSRVADATVVESYVAPCDFQLGGQTVKKGSWIVVMRVNDPALWQQILRGEITGYSVGGFGELTPLASVA